MPLKAVDTVWKSFSTTKTKLLWFARIALGKYFNLIIRKHTKTCYLMKSLWVINFSLVLRSNFFPVCMCVVLVVLRFYLGCFCCPFSSPVAFWLIFDCNHSYYQSFPLHVRTHEQIYGFQCFNVLMTLTTFKLWICCICIYERERMKWDRKRQRSVR